MSPKQILGQIDDDGFHPVVETKCTVDDCVLPPHADDIPHSDVDGQEFVVFTFNKAEHQDKRVFDSGATRDTDDDKLDYEGFLSPLVLQEYAKYMHRHRYMKDGSVRDADNWQKGFPPTVAEKSLNRHHMDFWIMHRMEVDEYVRPDGERVTKREALAGMFFNIQAIWLQEIMNG